MKKLSDFQGEEAFRLVADLLIPIGNMATSPAVKNRGNQTPIEFVSNLLKTNAEDMKTIFAILNEKDPKEYECSAVSILTDAVMIFSDPVLMELFGLQSQTATSSGSVTENTEV